VTYHGWRSLSWRVTRHAASNGTRLTSCTVRRSKDGPTFQEGRPGRDLSQIVLHVWKIVQSVSAKSSLRWLRLKTPTGGFSIHRCLGHVNHVTTSLCFGSALNARVS
jgi:hypothetical protein